MTLPPARTGGIEVPVNRSVCPTLRLRVTNQMHSLEFNLDLDQRMTKDLTMEVIER